MLQKPKDEVVLIKCQWQQQNCGHNILPSFHASTNKKTAHDSQTVQATRPNSMTLTNIQLNLSHL